MKYLVTGGTGFVGSHIASALLKQGHDVAVTGSCPERVPKGAKFLPHNMNGIDWRGIGEIQAVFHQAANNNTLEADYNQVMKSNYYAGTDLFLALLHQCGCRKYIYASSTAVYGNKEGVWKESDNNEENPLNPYGISKLKFDSYAMGFAMRHNVTCIGLRYCNVYGLGESHKGPRMSMVSQLFNQIRAGKQPKLFKDGEQKREWLYVKDAVSANLKALNCDESNIFNCCTGRPYTFNEVVDVIRDKYETEYLKPEYLETEYIDNPNPETYQSHVETSVSKIKYYLKWQPEYDLPQGIDEMMQASD
jgi:ADP-L-glycero-D-manno-heptose 6-epimerase